jgi:hypothetical protein
LDKPSLYINIRMVNSIFMNKIPLMNRLRKEYHKKVAYAQDLLVIELYSVIPDTVLHGGTVIWRCYGGNRFSEDIDAIIPVKYRYILLLNLLLNNLLNKFVFYAFLSFV